MIQAPRFLSGGSRDVAECIECPCAEGCRPRPQALLAQLVLVGFLFLVTYVRPYSRGVDNHLQMLSVVGARPLRRRHCRLASWTQATLLNQTAETN